MNNELKRIWKVAAVAYIKALSGHLLVGTEENHRKSQSG
jgi:hypothetical protein